MTLLLATMLSSVVNGGIQRIPSTPQKPATNSFVYYKTIGDCYDDCVSSKCGNMSGDQKNQCEQKCSAGCDE